FEDPLTVGPSPNSTLWGYARGTIAFSNTIVKFDLHVSIAYIFTSGRYKGSTVVAVGRNDVSQKVREFPIVGGTGAFKLARGIVTGSTYSTHPPIFIYDLEIIRD
ncbi:dirigent protein 1, partial [Phtheirospermum japonicum]